LVVEVVVEVVAAETGSNRSIWKLHNLKLQTSCFHQTLLG
jgi:hypothetical protein